MIEAEAILSTLIDLPPPVALDAIAAKLNCRVFELDYGLRELIRAGKVARERVVPGLLAYRLTAAGEKAARHFARTPSLRKQVLRVLESNSVPLSNPEILRKLGSVEVDHYQISWALKALKAEGKAVCIGLRRDARWLHAGHAMRYCV